MFPNLSLCKSLIVATLVLAAAPVAHAEKRLALVIGQSAYRSVPALPNPGNDARKMTELLGTAGFDVTAASDLTQNQMRESVSDFAQKIAASGPDTVALLFYAGHGLQIDGENYLVPVDVDPKRETDIPLQAVRLNDVMNTLGGLPTRLRIVLLDACRNNPFPALGTGTGHGLAIVDTKAGSAGTFISYSTSPGAVAEDGNGENSPYTSAVSPSVNVTKPGQSGRRATGALDSCTRVALMTRAAMPMRRNVRKPRACSIAGKNAPSASRISGPSTTRKASANSAIDPIKTSPSD